MLRTGSVLKEGNNETESERTKLKFESDERGAKSKEPLDPSDTPRAKALTGENLERAKLGPVGNRKADVMCVFMDAAEKVGQRPTPADTNDPTRGRTKFI